MSAIFISHSSQDNAIAAELSDRLSAQGHRSVFLDFDPEQGIPAGRDWELELYHQLRSCQAMIVLCSAHSMSSKWCFAEITHAKALGKHLVPLKVGTCSLDSILTERQVLDLTGDTEKAYQSLCHSLKTAGLDPANAFDWDASRPPYPGLLAFQELDAPIFFGRDEEIHRGLDLLNRLRQFGGSRTVMVLGASGSGKSSLVRAGLLPRLRLNQDEWLVVAPFRPQECPFQELAIVLAEAFQQRGEQSNWREIRDTLEQAAEADPVRANALTDLALDLCLRAKQRAATVLLVIDQTEELLSAADTATANRFLRLLGAALEVPNSPLMALCTLRSDFLGDFQQHPVARHLAFEDLRVGPLSVDQLVKVIEGPADKIGLQLESGLAMAMVNDTETEDALPLLAFTLRELYERYGQAGRLQIEEYRDKLGGLAGSVAQAADAVFGAELLSREQEADLHSAFLKMVRISEEGQYARKVVRWWDLPSSVHTTLEHFVQARLLVSHGERSERILEVAHEALFRSWDRLWEWIQGDQEFLLWRQRLRVALGEWLRNERDTGTLLRGAPLAEAERWLQERPDNPNSLDQDERDLIQESLALREREAGEQEEQHRRELKAAQALTEAEEQRAQEAEGRAQAQSRATAVQRQRTRIAVSLGLFAAVLATFAIVQYNHAEHERRVASAGQSAARAELIRGQQPDLLPQSVSLAAEAVRQFLSVGKYSPKAEYTLRTGLALLPRPIGALPQKEWVTLVAYSPDGTLLATASGQAVRIWQVPSGKDVAQLLHEERVTAVAYSPDGTLLATASGQVVRIWQVLSGEEVAQLPHKERVTAVAYSPDGTLLATASGQAVRIWQVPSGEAVTHLPHEEQVMPIAYSPDGTALATASGHMIYISNGEKVKLLIHPDQVTAVTYSSDGAYVATTSDDRTARVWEVRSGREVRRVKHSRDSEEVAITPEVNASPPGEIRGIALSPDGTYLATASDDRTARVWEVHSGREVTRIADVGAVNAVAFSPNGTSLATASTDGTRVWEMSRGGEITRLPHEYSVTLLTFSSDGQYLTTATSGDHVAQVWEWEVSSGREMVRMMYEGVVTAVTHSPDGQHLASGSLDKTALMWDVSSGEEVARLTLEDGLIIVTHSPDGQYLATANDTKACMWQTSDNTEVVCLQHAKGATAFTFSVDGQYLATASGENIVRVWAVPSGEEVARMSPDSHVHTMTFSPDGQYLATASWDTARIWEAASGEEVARLLHDDQVRALVFNPNGQYLATASGVTSRVWEIPGGREVARILQEQGVNTVAFSPDGRYLATGSTDATARVLLWRPEDLIDAACALLTRDLTPQEWRLYLGDEPYQKTCPQLP